MSNLQLVERFEPKQRLLTDITELHVRTCDVQKCYRLGESNIWALRGVSLELGRGEFVALCGTSGSGKTTLLNLLGCLDTPSFGEIYIAGRNVSRMNDRELAQFRSEQLGFVFQTFNLIPVLSALENVEYPLLKIRGMNSKERRERARHALALVGLEKLASHRPDELSGGQRQRAAIARAFVHRPELIIADEPTANLDRKTAAGILDLMADLNRTMGVSIVVATHDPIVMERAGRTVNIVDGRLTR